MRKSIYSKTKELDATGSLCITTSVDLNITGDPVTSSVPIVADKRTTFKL